MLKSVKIGQFFNFAVKCWKRIGMQSPALTLDVIIPCYNASETLERAVNSCLKQAEVRFIWLVDDASTDDTWEKMQALKQDYCDRIRLERFYENGGAAKARNFAAIQSDADLIAFLDADDEYQQGALTAAKIALQQLSYIGLVRLRMQAIDFPSKYTEHERFGYAWQQQMMTVAGNTVFRRLFFLACGGFPQHYLFRCFGGEDGALGLATVKMGVVGTLFDQNVAGVLHYYRENIHGARLLDAILFEKHHPDILPKHLDQANQVTAQITQHLQAVKSMLNVEKTGVVPLKVTYN